MFEIHEVFKFVSFWFLMFMIYSFIGWIFECIWTSIEQRKLQNRGFLFGPICPIYGVGMVSFLILTQEIHFEWYIEFFIFALICTVIEYTTSVVMEKIFRVRWWDYSETTRFNLNGRVSLETSLGFGLGGMAIKYGLHPFILHLISPLSWPMIESINGVLLTILVIDIIFTTVATLKLRDKFSAKFGSTKIDVTSEIKKLTREYYSRAARFKRHMTKAAMENIQKTQENIGNKINSITKSKK